MIQQALFIILTTIAVFLFIKKCKEIYTNIQMGKPAALVIDKHQGWKNVLLLAFGQKKMFKKPLVAILHLVVYIGFIIVNIELVEIVLDGILGTHRIFSFAGSLYTSLINAFEVLAALVIIACMIFLIRRNIFRIHRLADKELNGWAKKDANIILITEIVLMSAFLMMNASDTLWQMRQGVQAHQFMVSKNIHPLLHEMRNSTLVFIERFCWWLHIIGIYGFAIYLSYSKHLHIILAFPNAYYAQLTSQTAMSNMPDIQREVLYVMEPDKIPQNTETPEPTSFGAKDVTDLSWKNLMDAYTCTECGRCSEACPAHSTGKVLSPRAIMMKTRDRLESLGRSLKKNNASEKEQVSLLHHYIKEEELWACTTCAACVEACPVSISPLNIIVQLRRYLIMEESKSPMEWNTMNTNIENNFAPWQFSPDDRAKWIQVK